MPTPTDFRNLIVAIDSKLAEIEGLFSSPVSFQAGAVPDSLTIPGKQAAFTLGIQTNDTGTERQRALMRVEHIVSVTMLSRVKQTGQWLETLGNGLDVEQEIIASCLTTRNYPGYDVRYLGTARSLDANREYLFHALQFAFEATSSTGAS